MNINQFYLFKLFKILINNKRSLMIEVRKNP